MECSPGPASYTSCYRVNDRNTKIKNVKTLIIITRAYKNVFACICITFDMYCNVLCIYSSADFTARYWDATSGQQKHEWAHPHVVKVI